MSRSPKAQQRDQRRTDRRAPTADFVEDVVVKPIRRPLEEVRPLTQRQTEYDAAIRSSRVIFGIGPAGTGKTWFAAMRAAEALQAGFIERIVLTRPAVEAGESLGFLPGELDEKYEPYVRPIRDALEEKFGTGELEYMLKRRIIDPRPLGLLRGSTMKNCWVLADEMQNATKNQMKMLLTRIGVGSKFIVNGDPRQTDLGEGQSGLISAIDITRHIKGIQTVRFGVEDVVRDDICQDIVRAYET